MDEAVMPVSAVGLAAAPRCSRRQSNNEHAPKSSPLRNCNLIGTCQTGDDMLNGVWVVFHDASGTAWVIAANDAVYRSFGAAGVSSSQESP
jgi:hypothetical protein